MKLITRAKAEAHHLHEVEQEGESGDNSVLDRDTRRVPLPRADLPRDRGPRLRRLLPGAVDSIRRRIIPQEGQLTLPGGGRDGADCAAGPRRRSLTVSWPTLWPGRAGWRSSGVRREWARPRCFSTCAAVPRGGRWQRPPASSRRSNLAYSGLHQVCRPILDHVDRLPLPQRHALEGVVFGRSTGPPLGPVSRRACHADAARRRPRRSNPSSASLDDAQWLDRSFGSDPGFRRPAGSSRSAIAIVLVARSEGADDVLVCLPGAPWCTSRGEPCPGAAPPERPRAVGCRRVQPDRRREPREPARADRAAADVERGRAGRRLRVARRAGGRREDRAELRAAKAMLLPAKTQLFVLAAWRSPWVTRRSSSVPPPRSASTWRRRSPRHRGRRSSVGRPHRVRPPARAVGRLPLGERRRPPPRPSSPRGGNRCREGSGSAGMAPRTRNAGPRRGGGRRARTLGGPGAGAVGASAPRRSCNAPSP